MLVLKRTRDQSIDIVTPDGTMISVMLVAHAKGWVKLGITAPNDCRVDRREVRLAKLKEEIYGTN